MAKRKDINMQPVVLTEGKKRPFTHLSATTARIKADSRTTYCVLFGVDISASTEGQTKLLMQRDGQRVFFIFHRQKKDVDGIELNRKSGRLETRRSEDFIKQTALPMLGLKTDAVYHDIQLTRSKMRAPFKAVIWEYAMPEDADKTDNQPTLFDM